MKVRIDQMLETAREQIAQAVFEQVTSSLVAPWYTYVYQ